MLQHFETCEACQMRPIQIVDDFGDSIQPYRLCPDCYQRLIMFSLRPREWYNLAVIHSPNPYYLHDDFYDEDGSAAQPEEEVVSPALYPAPSLEEAAYHLEDLLDYAMTRWFLEEAVIQALQAYNQEKLLHSVAERFSSTINHGIKARLLQITAHVLGANASEWVREQWVHYDKELLSSLSEAAVYCLSPEEGFALITERLNYIEGNQLPITAFSCLHHFRSPLVLNWIEKKVTTFHESWGRLAALSKPTWSRMKVWLEQGRPLSLLALEAMVRCIPSSGKPVYKMEPKILQTNISEVESVLEKYRDKDYVPRVKMQVQQIVKYKDAVFLEGGEEEVEGWFDSPF